MKNRNLSRTPIEPPSLPKTRTGIRGLDEITEGGLPKGRPTITFWLALTCGEREVKSDGCHVANIYGDQHRRSRI